MNWKAAGNSFSIFADRQYSFGDICLLLLLAGAIGWILGDLWRLYRRDK